MQTFASLFLFALLAGSVSAGSARPPKSEILVNVSGANYRETPYETLTQYAQEHAVIPIDSAPSAKAPTSSTLYIFAPGDRFSNDPSFEELCRSLEPALARRGFVQAAKSDGSLEPDAQPKLVIRISYGQRTWRVPLVRVQQLNWSDGLVATDKAGGLRTAGTSKPVWSYYAGGKDSALDDLRGADNAGRSDSLNFQTKPYNLIVLDAFEFAEVVEKRNSAKRVWSTFISCPADDERGFKDVVGIMIRTATPYFGETTRGLQQFPDARTNIELGEAVEVK